MFRILFGIGIALIIFSKKLLGYVAEKETELNHVSYEYHRQATGIVVIALTHLIQQGCQINEEVASAIADRTTKELLPGFDQHFDKSLSYYEKYQWGRGQVERHLQYYLENATDLQSLSTLHDECVERLNRMEASGEDASNI